MKWLGHFYTHWDHILLWMDWLDAQLAPVELHVTRNNPQSSRQHRVWGRMNPWWFGQKMLLNRIPHPLRPPTLLFHWGWALDWEVIPRCLLHPISPSILAPREPWHSLPTSTLLKNPPNHHQKNKKLLPYLKQLNWQVKNSANAFPRKC